MNISPSYLLPPLPENLTGLAAMAMDLRWSWSRAADPLWERIDPELWALTRNPLLILQNVSAARLKALGSDREFCSLLEEHFRDYQERYEGTTWFETQQFPASVKIAYFSMEFGLSEALPIYSGGLGILAGDHLKTASDLGVPLVGVGLLYQQGYFRQSLDARGNQTEFFPYNDPSQLPILPVRDAGGEWVRIDLDFPGRPLRLRAWEVKVGRVKLYLLDSNDPLNSPSDRGITSELYGGGPELRLQQEIALGIGGWRLLQRLGIETAVCHLNEGHAALAVLERARTVLDSHDQSFETALAATRVGNIFTTHTPVEAGFDRFPAELVGQYLGAYADRLGIGLEGLLALGRQDPDNSGEPLNMALLAIRGAGSVNGVSRLHGAVSRRIFQPLFPRWPQSQVPVTHVTNGVHIPSWDSTAADRLWSEACGSQRWLGTLESIEEDLRLVPDEKLWAFRCEGRRQLIQHARERLAWQLEAAGSAAQDVEEARHVLDPHFITIGFARRFATYKRPNLLLHDPARLERLLTHPRRPIQILIAGKAHPLDEAGKALVRAWTNFIRRPAVRSRIVFIADYDMALAEQLVQGVDLWLNTPRRPWEASGTSGMKVLVNGGLNISELDGWWAEAYRPEVGWALGDGCEHDADPQWDAHEAQQLYGLLEGEIIPAFYERDAAGIPHAWVERMRESMGELTPRFSTNRMLREYVEQLYLPAAQEYQERTKNGADKARRIYRWQLALRKCWPRVHFGRMELHQEADRYQFTVPVYLDDLDPLAVNVELYAEPQQGRAAEIHGMTRGEALPGAVNGYLYHVEVAMEHPADYYTPRIVPSFQGVAVPLEAPQILWYES